MAVEAHRELRSWVDDNLIPGTPILKLAQRTEWKIQSLGFKPSMPVCICPNGKVSLWTPDFDHTRKLKSNDLITTELGFTFGPCRAAFSSIIDGPKTVQDENLLDAPREAIGAVLKEIGVGFRRKAITGIIKEVCSSFDDVHWIPQIKSSVISERNVLGKPIGSLLESRKIKPGDLLSIDVAVSSGSPTVDYSASPQIFGNASGELWCQRWFPHRSSDHSYVPLQVSGRSSKHSTGVRFTETSTLVWGEP